MEKLERSISVSQDSYEDAKKARKVKEQILQLDWFDVESRVKRICNTMI